MLAIVFATIALLILILIFGWLTSKSKNRSRKDELERFNADKNYFGNYIHRLTSDSKKKKK